MVWATGRGERGGWEGFMWPEGRWGRGEVWAREARGGVRKAIRRGREGEGVRKHWLRGRGRAGEERAWGQWLRGRSDEGGGSAWAEKEALGVGGRGGKGQQEQNAPCAKFCAGLRLGQCPGGIV